jgi:hypothetical protein
MSSFRRLALLLALSLPAMHAVQAQSSSSSSDPASQAQSSAQPGQTQGQAQSQAQNQPQVSVQARIRARRAARRAAAIKEVYSHLYEAYAGGGYQRFVLASPLQRVNEYAWDAGLTRYFSQRLGVTVGGRGYYGTAYTYNNGSNIFKPAISQYAVMGGPTYRFYMQPRYSISGRVMGGLAIGDFSGDTAGAPISLTHLYPDGDTFAIEGSILGEYNLSPGLGLRLGGNYFGSGFGSTLQNNFGFTGAVVYRFGKQ